MKKFTLLSLGIIVLTLSCHGLNELSKKEKDDLAKNGDVPMNDIKDPDTKKRIENILIKILAETIDFEASEKARCAGESYGSGKEGKEKCEEAKKKCLNAIPKNRTADFQKTVKDNEAKLKTLLADKKANEIANCAEKMKSSMEVLAKLRCDTTEEEAKKLKEEYDRIYNNDDAKCNKLLHGIFAEIGNLAPSKKGGAAPEGKEAPGTKGGGGGAAAAPAAGGGGAKTH